jgi:predicted nucleic acid-binding protein
MAIILDASAAIAWLKERDNPDEAALAINILHAIEAQEAIVPPLWFTELTNGMLMIERYAVAQSQTIVRFAQLVETLPINSDNVSPSAVQNSYLLLARLYNLTAYDATYLELALRTRCTLATFDRKLATAARSAGVQVFGDPQ